AHRSRRRHDGAGRCAATPKRRGLEGGHPMKRTGRILTATALSVGLLAPAAAITGTPTIAAADEADSTCQVTGGELTWGVKEAFRSYISGAIANGEWTVSDGAGYETPSFSFSEPTGEIDAETGEGSVTFA